MDEIELSEGQYASFLVRLWRTAEPESEGSSGNWRAEVEHIQSGRLWQFADLEDLFAYMRRQVENSDRVLPKPLVCGHTPNEGTP